MANLSTPFAGTRLAPRYEETESLMTSVVAISLPNSSVPKKQ